jgi:nitroreductase
MNVFEAIQQRRSVRAYQAREVEPDKLQAILSAANQAPSAGNLQAYQIYLTRSELLKRALAKASLDQTFIIQAPVVLIFCAAPGRAARYGRRGEQLYCVQDATVALAYAQLAATAQGLSTCWVGAFDEGQVASALGLPAELRPVGILPIGYAAEAPAPTPRRPLENLVTKK